jgi:hypothetical protein
MNTAIAKVNGGLNRNLSEKKFLKASRRYLAPRIGNSSYEARSTAMGDFLPEFKAFLVQSGINQQIQQSMGFQFNTAIDPRWDTSTCDNISAKCNYLGMHFSIWSNGPKKDGSIEFHLFGNLPSGKYRSGACLDPEEFGRKFALLVCEAERIKDLKWFHRVPSKIEGLFQCILTFVMCVSFIVAPQNDWEKLDYLAVFTGLTVCTALSYLSRVKECDSLIDSEINQQAIAF